MVISIDFAVSVNDISFVLITFSIIKSGLFKIKDKSLTSISFLDILFSPICFRVFSPGSSEGRCFRKIFSSEVSTQLFFLANPIAGPKTFPSSFWRSCNFFDSFFNKSSNLLSGNPL